MSPLSARVLAKRRGRPRVAASVRLAAPARGSMCRAPPPRERHERRRGVTAIAVPGVAPGFPAHEAGVFLVDLTAACRHRSCRRAGAPSGNGVQCVCLCPAHRECAVGAMRCGQSGATCLTTRSLAGDLPAHGVGRQLRSGFGRKFLRQRLERLALDPPHVDPPHVHLRRDGAERLAINEARDHHLALHLWKLPQRAR